jgi:hypothetical protein
MAVRGHCSRLQKEKNKVFQMNHSSHPCYAAERTDAPAVFEKLIQKTWRLWCGVTQQHWSVLVIELALINQDTVETRKGNLFRVTEHSVRISCHRSRH